MNNFITLSLGSNEGDRKANLNLAIKYINNFATVQKISNVYESDALLLPNSPPEWNKNFYNICLSAITDLGPLQLLEKVKEVELAIAGAKRELRWSPRAIDIDIVSFNKQVFAIPTKNNDVLHIPHKGVLERTFVLWPLAEIYPDWQFIENTKADDPPSEFAGKTALELAQNFGLKFPEELGQRPAPLNTKCIGGL